MRLVFKNVPKIEGCIKYLKFLCYSLVQKILSLFSNKLPSGYYNQVSSVRSFEFTLKIIFFLKNGKNKNSQFTTPENKSSIFRHRKIRDSAINRLLNTIASNQVLSVEFQENLLHIKFLQSELIYHLSTFSTFPLQSTI